MKTSIRVEHLARVEGHGGVTVELDGDAVSAVRFDIFEGVRLLEGLIRGRSFDEVSPIVSRICAICSVAHSLTSIKATENAFGVQVTPQTDLLRDLLYRGESIESHALHLFLLALPDYLGYPSAIALAADRLDAVALGLRLKKLGNSIQETVGGRAVHPVNAVPGGFARIPVMEQWIALRRDLLQGMSDVRTAIDIVASLPPADACQAETAFAALRPAGDYGYYQGDEICFASNGTRAEIRAADYRSLANEKAVPHSHAKHSSFGGRPFMVGSLARLTINRDMLDAPAAADIDKLKLALPSGNPTDNNKAQAVELATDVARALEIVETLLEYGTRDEAPVPVRPRAGSGTAATEAPRGLLIHSYTYDEAGRIATADVITPTAFNAASIEEHLRRAVEQSAARDVPALTRKLEMVVRAYDPCISCSVHLVRVGQAVPPAQGRPNGLPHLYAD